MTKLILLEVPEGGFYDLPKKQLARLCTLLREAGHGWEEFADSARLVDMEARRRCEFYGDGEPMLENQGYNACLDDLQKGV